MMIKAKEIKLIAINKLKPNRNNRNIHTKEQIDMLARVIKYQGFRSPVVVSNQSGLMVTGHARVKAAKTAGMKEVPVIFQDFDNSDQEYAHAIADNSLALQAELDMSGINDDMQILGPDFDLGMIGIPDFTLDMSDKLDEDDDEVSKTKLKIVRCPHCKKTFEAKNAKKIDG